MKNICYFTGIIFFWLCGVAFAAGQDSGWLEASLGFLMLFGMAWLGKLLVFGPSSKNIRHSPRNTRDGHLQGNGGHS